MIQTLLIWSVAAPLAVMLAVLFVAMILRRVIRVVDRVLSNGRVVVIALAFGYGVAHIGLGHAWGMLFPPSDVKMWLVYYLPVVVLVSLFRSAGWMRWWVRLVADILLFTGFCVILLWKVVGGGDGGLREVVLHAGGLGVVYGIFVLMMEEGARRLGALVLLFPLGLWVAVCAVSFGMMASVNTGMQTGAIASGVGVVFVSAWLGGRKGGKDGGWLMVPIIFYLVMGNGMEVYYFSYAERAIVSLGLAGGGIILSGLVVLCCGRWLRRKPKRGVIVLVMLMVGPAVGGAVVAYYGNVYGS